MKKKALTLVETLITIGIIGIVAALTIPTLIKQYQRKVFETQFKKAYSQLKSAYKLMQEEDTEDVYSEYYHYTDGNGTALRESFYKHLKGNYLPKSIYSNPKPYYTSKKGSTTIMHYCPASCCGNPAKSSQAFLTFDNIMYYACARDGRINFSFDINGNDKGPNKWGVDFFDFEISSENKLHADGRLHACRGYTLKNLETNSNDGIDCSYNALNDKDYFKKIDW
jgi:type II secretory pathway pseudopilin PulG